MVVNKSVVAHISASLLIAVTLITDYSQAAPSRRRALPGSSWLLDSGSWLLLPEPRGSAYSARIAVDRFLYRRLEDGGKGIARELRGEFGVKLVDVGHAAAHHKDVRVKCVDDNR